MELNFTDDVLTKTKGKVIVLTGKSCEKPLLTLFPTLSLLPPHSRLTPV